MKILLIGALIFSMLFWGYKPVVHPAKGVILLDFNGYSHPVSTVHRDSVGPAIIPDSTKQRIIDIVKYHYRYWDVLITENDSIFYSYPQNKRVRAVISSDRFYAVNWFLQTMTDIPAISYYNSLYLEDTTPCVVSASYLEYSRWIGDATAHEIGHQLGLAHQSRFDGINLLEEYRRGDSIEGPIMGYPYGSKRSVWTIGTNILGQEQNDTEIISKTFKRIH